MHLLCGSGGAVRRDRVRAGHVPADPALVACQRWYGSAESLSRG